MRTGLDFELWVKEAASSSASPSDNPYLPEWRVAPLRTGTGVPTEKRRPGKRARRAGALLTALGTSLILLQSSQSLAETSTPLTPAEVMSLRPSALTRGFYLLNGTWSPTPLAPVLQLTLDGAFQPLRLRDEYRNFSPWIAGSLDAHLTGGLSLGSRLSLEAEVPFRAHQWMGEHWQPSEQPGGALPEAPEVDGVGDMVVRGHVRLLRPTLARPLGLTLLPTLQLPTGNALALVGEQQVQGSLSATVYQALGSGPLPGAVMAANLGLHLRSEPVWIQDGSLLHQLDFKVGLSQVESPGHQGAIRQLMRQAIPWLTPWHLTHWAVEVAGSVPISTYTSPLPPPIEAIVSAHVQGPGAWSLQPVFSLGLQPGYGIPTAAAGIGLQYWRDPASDVDADGIVDRQDACPSQPEDLDQVKDADGCPDDDNDADGYPDATDRCPDAPEDLDQFGDDDGCPDFDNDLDGVPDSSDKCPLSAEDRDGWQDDDGCVDPDNDGDAIFEPLDRCPNEREDRDGFQDADGCPEPDNDGDGLSDLEDQCPDAAENHPDGPHPDGCPDPETPTPVAPAPGSALSLSAGTTFGKNSAEILPETLPVLEEVTSLLLQFPDLRLRIEAHTDDKGSESLNRRLSQRRADALKHHLEGKGIAPSRLEAEGVGEARPLRPDTTDEARAANRRIVWTVLPPASASAPDGRE